MTTTRVWLVRHGEPASRARQRCYGSLDIGLSDSGRNQIARVAEYLKTMKIGNVFASPLSRTHESAQIIAAACTCPCEIEDGLREIHFGDFEGLTYDEIAARYPDLYRLWMEHPTRIQFPNGESLTTMRVRVLEAFERILRLASGRSVALVTHGGVIRILIAHVLHVPDECFFRIAQQYAAMSLLTFSDGIPSVGLVNLSV